MVPDRSARPEYVAAFSQIAARIAASLAGSSKKALPIKMYVAGGAAMHFYTGERVSKDIDASFSHRIALPIDLEVSYRDADGGARLLYFDHQYNETLGLMHEDAHADAIPLALEGVDRSHLDVRLLSPVDLAVSKVGRFSEFDRQDILTLARRRLIRSRAFRERAEQTAEGYVGNTEWLHRSIETACQIIEDAEGAKKR